MKQIEIVSDFSGPVLVAVLFLELMSFTTTVLGKPKHPEELDKNWTDGLLFLFKYVVNMTSLVLAAEAHSKVLYLNNSS